LIGRFHAIAGEAAVVIGETGDRVHNELPIPAVAMGVLSFLALVALLWVTTLFNPDR